MYAESVTNSMEKAISETNRRRHIQMEYNKKMGITPRTIQKSIHDTLETLKVAEDEKEFIIDHDNIPVEKMIEELTAEMRAAAKELEFEKAAMLRDRINDLKKKLNEEKTVKF